MTVTLITPTGDRPEAFRLCEHHMRRQTYTGPLQWIVVDDGQVPTKTTCGQQVIRRAPRADDPPHTLCRNLRCALPHVAGERILVIEDDDYYAPEYLARRLAWLETADLVGEVGAKYYFVDRCQWRVFREHEHASLCRTGFSRAVLPLLAELAEDDDWRLDLRLWRRWEGSRYLAGNDGLSASLKHLPGRASVSQRIGPDWTLHDDPHLATLKEWTGDAWRLYLPWLAYGPPPDNLLGDLTVYTVCLGGYDRLQPQPTDPRVRYVAITDADSVPAPWHRRPWRPPDDLSTRRASRLPKIRAHAWFPGRTTLYLDANLRLERSPRDLAAELIRRRPEAWLWALRHNERDTLAAEAEAVVRYRFDDRAAVRRHLARYADAAALPLAWGGLLLRRAGCGPFNELWWREYAAGSQRDQLSLPWALARAGLPYALCDVPYPRRRGEPGPWLTSFPHCRPRQEADA